jgi:eukaryotic-like serine/threonine-protein kinase
VLDYGFDRGQPFFTMELLTGADSILEAGEHERRTEQVSLLVQMLRALAYLHRRGILHRDLKPRNILVSEAQVKVLDFGLSSLRGQASNAFGSTAGTLAYMAPEVLLGEDPTEAADLYAVGVVAYEMFSGKHPFESDNLSVMIDNVLTAPPDFDTTGIEVPLALVLDRLLAKEPIMRYNDANDVIVDLGLSIGMQIAPETAATRESFLQSARLIGRDPELAILFDGMNRMLEGAGSAWLVGGESGVGKSRLVDELRVQALVRGATVMRGQAVSEGSRPYQLWRGTWRWLPLLVELNEEDDALIRAFIADNAPTIDPEQTQTRLLRIFENILRREKQPIVLILEDLQWAGSESLSLLARLSKMVRDLPLMIIATYRDDEAPNLPQQFPDAQLLKLNRLSEKDIAVLSEAMLGEGGREPHIVDLLKRETEGNVYFIVEVVRALAEEVGRLDRIAVATLPSGVFVGGMRRVVQRRLDRVPAWAHPLLRVAAVAGRELDLRLLREAAPDTDLDAWLLAVANAAVIEAQGDQWYFAHDKLRTGVIDVLSEEERCAVHGTVASAIEAISPDQAAALAYHWGRAGDHEREMYYTLIAGEQSLRVGAYREAVKLLERALELETDPEGIANLLHKIGEAHVGMGHYTIAWEKYQEALSAFERIEHGAGMARVLGSLGDVAHVREDYMAAEQYYSQALEHYRALNDLHGMSRALNSLGNVAFEMDDDDRAMQLYQESLALSRQIGSGWGKAGSFAGDDDDD